MTDEELIKLSRENLRKSKQGSLCECYDEAFIKGYKLSEKRIAELEKENTELKSITDFQTSSNMDRYFQLKRSKEQLTKAKKIIGNLYPICKDNHCPNSSVLMEQAEQFLKEEKENGCPDFGW